MERIKSYNINWKDIFSPQKSFNKKAETYLDRFKKTYEERNKPENILVECLYNLEFIDSRDNRFLGAAEGVLLMEDYIKPGEKFEYKEMKGMLFKTKETYREHIIRLVKEYLTDHGVI